MFRMSAEFQKRLENIVKDCLKGQKELQMKNSSFLNNSNLFKMDERKINEQNEFIV
jgi:hypothetical protein